MSRDILYKDDKALIEGILNQENEAFEYMYNNYFKMIQKLILNNNGEIEDVKDVFQEGIISIYEKAIAKKLILTSSFSTFFYSICRYKWLNKLREQKLYVEINDSGNEFILIQEDSFNLDIKMEKLNRITELGEKCQQLLKLFYYEKKSMEQISQILNYTNGKNAKQQKARCIKYLKKLVYDK